MSDDVGGHSELRSYLTLGASGISLTSALLILHVYFLHAHLPSLLRSSFNNVLVWAILMQGLQSAQRMAAASMLLSQSMTSVGCNILGSANVFLDIASQVLIVGFYYRLASLRRNPFLFILRHFEPKTSNFVRQYALFALAGLMGTCGVMLALAMLPMSKSTPGCIYETYYGWCSLPSPNRSGGSADLVFFLEVIVLAVIIASVSIASFISFRLQFWRSFECSQHWTVVVRWSAIIFFMIAAYFSDGILDLAGAPPSTVDSVTSCVFPLLGFFLAAVFIATEKVGFVLVGDCMSCLSRRRNDDVDDPLRADSFSPSAGALNGFTAAIGSLSVSEVVGESMWLGSAGVEEHGAEHPRIWGHQHQQLRSGNTTNTGSRSQSVVVVRR
jgi:hypothetical protein